MALKSVKHKFVCGMAQKVNFTMNIKSNEMSQHDKEKIFGVKEAPNFSTDGLELRYEAEDGQEGETDYLWQRVFRDENGNYFIAVKGGIDATFGFETRYYLDGREVLIPTRPEALASWAEHNLPGEECKRALDEFKIPEHINFKTVWLFQQGNIHEVLWKSDGDFCVLFSTDNTYPCLGCNVPLVDFDGSSGGNRDDLYCYYIAPETARRWAEARGMDEETCQKVFGH